MSLLFKAVGSIDSISHLSEAQRDAMADKKDDSGRLYYGDNLGVLQEYVDDESVDLIYLDPPFKSDAQYNVIFERPDGHGSQAGAFHDTWTWTSESEVAFESVIRRGDRVSETLSGMMSFLGKNDTMAYLCMMAPRLLELKRTLKPTGSIYLHCDPTASHYLKILLDGVFGFGSFKNHIAWRRSDSHSDVKRKWPATSDHLLFYTKDPDREIIPQYKPYPERTLREWYLYLELPNGSTRRMTKKEIETQQIPSGARRFNTADMSAPAGGGMAAINKQTGKTNGWHIYKGYEPPARGWRYSPETMARLDADGLLLFPNSKSGRIMLKRYLDEQRGVIVGDIWDDIQHLRAATSEALGYPTQKPLALLERIISASSNPGDVVLDPFCGCGTAVDAAQKLGRRWIGIDVTHYAVTVIEGRLRKQFNGLTPRVVGRPEDLAGAWDLARRDKYQFQWWANWLVGVQNYREQKTGGDQGIDGKIFFMNGPYGTGRVIVSVKGGDTVNPSMIRDLIGTVNSEKAELGLFVCIAEPTQGMTAAAAKAGMVKTAHGMFPKVQIITIEELLSGKKANLPPYFQAEGERRISGKKRQAQSAQPQLSFKFPIPGGKSGRKRGEVIYPAASLLLAR